MAANLTKAAIDYNPSGLDGKGDKVRIHDSDSNGGFQIASVPDQY